MLCFNLSFLVTESGLYPAQRAVSKDMAIQCLASVLYPYVYSKQ